MHENLLFRLYTVVSEAILDHFKQLCEYITVHTCMICQGGQLGYKLGGEQMLPALFHPKENVTSLTAV